MKRQTPQERKLIKASISKELPSDTLAKIAIMDDASKVVEKSTGQTFTCLEVQLKGCLVEQGIRRRYISYTDLENYEVRN